MSDRPDAGDDSPANAPSEPSTPEERRAWRPGDRKIAEPRREEDALRCGYCGAPIAEDQTYCLECGSPTPKAPRIRGARGAAALIAVGLVALGAGSGVLAYVVADDEGDDASGTTTTALTIPPAADAGATSGASPSATVPDPPTTSGLPTETDPFPTDTEPSPTDTGELPTDTTATETVPLPETDEPFPTVTGPEPGTATDEGPVTTPEPDPFPPPDAGGDSDWPVGRTGWTAVLSSVRSEADARAAADRLSAQGESVGVLFSSDHPNLEPGFWVVYSGVFDTQGAAAARASALTGEFPGAYARRIVS